jgi:hypothetical protein
MESLSPWRERTNRRTDSSDAWVGPGGNLAFWTVALTDWTSAIATGFAAIASGAAAYNTVSARRAAQERQRPFLTIQPLTNKDELHFDVYNVGEGVAMTCGYIAMRGDRKAFGYIAHGTLRTGEHSRIRTLLTADVSVGEIYSAFICRDVRGKLWGWTTHDPQRQALRGTDIGLLEAWSTLYPGTALPKGDSTKLPSDSLTPRQAAAEEIGTLWDDLSERLMP